MPTVRLKELKRTPNFTSRRARRDGTGVDRQRRRAKPILKIRNEPWRSQSRSVSVARSANQITARAARACTWKSNSTEVQLRMGGGFSQRLKGFSAQARDAVDRELHRNLSPEPEARADSDEHSEGIKSHNGRSRAPRPATPNQVRAIQAIAQHRGVDLDQLLAADFNAKRAEELTIVEASLLIERLQADPISFADSAEGP